jgi:hypothetical protein
METLTEDQITDTLKASLEIMEGKSDHELVRLLSIQVVQSGEDFLRDQGLIRSAIRRIETLKQENKSLAEHFFKSDAFLAIALDEFEARFDREGKCDSVEIAIWYMAAAKQLEGVGRRNNAIKFVQEWYDAYPESFEPVLTVDGNECTLTDFLKTNTKDIDVDHITYGDVKRVKALQRGESLFIGLVEIKRIK